MSIVLFYSCSTNAVKVFVYVHIRTYTQMYRHTGLPLDLSDVLYTEVTA